MPPTPPPAGPRLALTRELATLFAAAVATAAIALGAAEGLCRLPAVRSRLPMPSYGSGPWLDVALARLSEFAAEEGDVECVVLGSSVVLHGIEAQQLSLGFAAVTGRPLHCFAVGLPALTPRGAVALASVLAADLRPRMLIYAVAALDVRDDTDRYAESAWIRHRNGSPSLRGFVAEHSVAYRYFLALRYRMLLPSYLELRSVLESSVDRRGYFPKDPVFLGRTPPFDDSRFPALAVNELTDLVRRLDQVATNHDAELFLVEMPTPEIAGSPPYGISGRLIETVEAVAGREKINFRRVSAEDVPARGFADGVHLNRSGAAACSARIGHWLGERAIRHANAGFVEREG
jgi:hypothetical protein